MPGLGRPMGRGAPGTPVEGRGVAGRGAPGTAGPAAPGAARVEPDRDMPEFSEEKGLLPGRGPIGRGPVLPPGRPGDADAAIESSPGSAWVAGAAGAAGDEGIGALGATGASTCAAGASTAAGAVSTATGADADAAFFAGALGAGAAGACAGAGKISRSLRTTGGSTVDDADRTNSPSSVSLVMTTLLSMPSSFASS